MEEEEIIEILKERGKKTKNLKGIAEETKIKIFIKKEKRCDLILFIFDRSIFL